jgi:hypothetical protein
VDPDDGILKVGGRLAFGEKIEESARYPAILTKSCMLSTLLALDYHKHTMHGGLYLCLAELRRAFWVIAARTLMRQVIRNCVTCYRFN